MHCTDSVSPQRVEVGIARNDLPAIPEYVHFRVFENGLTLMVREDHSAPVAAVQVWVKTGSIDESKWLGARISHLLEHMVFKGTTQRTGARLDQEVQEPCGYMNADT